MHTLGPLFVVLAVVAAVTGHVLVQSRASANDSTYSLAKAYSGADFFDGWDYYGAPDLLLNGDVNWVTEAQAVAEKLAYVNDAGNAIVKVDNTTYIPKGQKRDTVRITSQDSFPIGTVFVIDALHLPYGCSVWPSIWTTDSDPAVAWPAGGEIDVIETVNQATTNQYSLHTEGPDGCFGVNDTGVQGGVAAGTDCASTATDDTGCPVLETKAASVGAAFAEAQGDVYAAQFDTSGIFIWFWSRPDIPPSVTSATNSIDVSSWGTPSAAFPSSTCDIETKFGPQAIVIDITLCGTWAGNPTVYSETCSYTGSLDANTCYYNSVIYNGTSDYADAYFEIQYIKAFTWNGQVNTTARATASGSASGTESASATSDSASASATQAHASSGSSSATSGARAHTIAGRGMLYAAVVAPIVAFFLAFVCW